MKKRTFAHLTQKKRDRLEDLLAEGVLQKKIAKILKVHTSTISREISKRKKIHGYDADAAQHKASVARTNSKYQGMKIETYPELKKEIIRQLKEKRSPDEIAGRMKREKKKPCISTKALYRWLYSPFGQRYCRYLCTKRYRKKPQKDKTVRVMIPDRVSITKRPRRKGLVHAEGDTLVSGRKTGSTAAASMIALTKSKLLLGHRLPNLKPKSMAQSVKRITKHVSIDTLTLDNGIENKKHRTFGVRTFFCDPHAPWQKPLVEQSIGLVRRWSDAKKGTDLKKVSPKQYQKTLHYLNSKYRKSLKYRSAYEAAVADGIMKKLPEK